jgi:non-heme chloroperoxidase
MKKGYGSSTLVVLRGLMLGLVLFAQEIAAQPLPKQIRANGADLHYVDQGKGVAVIFVHGGLDDYRVWQGQMDGFSRRYHVVTYSRRYNYPNAQVQPRSDYSVLVDADDLAALIRKLKLAPAHVVGVSHGAYVSLLLAARHPELVRSLVLSEPPLLRWLPRLEGGKPLYDDFMNKIWDPATRGFREQDEAGIKAAVDGFGELGYSGSDEKMTYATLPAEVRSAAMENALEWRALTASRDAFPDLSFTAVSQIKVPTLLLSGQHSLALHGLIDSKLEQLLPRNERVILPKATHEMWNEYPEDCRNAALAFFARH